MRRPAKLALRSLSMVVAITAFAAVATALYGPASGTETPYMSALSDLALGSPALAACPLKTCDTTGSFCVQAIRAHRCHAHGGTCTTLQC
jgi:hypothetical protein